MKEDYKKEEIKMLDQLQHLFEKYEDGLNIIDEAIDINLQLEYFKLSAELKINLDSNEIIKRIDDIFDNQLPDNEKKKLLIQLASINEIKAFRAIEKYHEQVTGDLSYWSKLALMESKMLIESNLLEKQQIIISTGLGGKGSKLRYFIVLSSKNTEPFSDFQKKIIKNEFEDVLKKQDSEIEKLDFADKYATLLAMVPIKIPLSNLFKSAISECNTYGNFIQDNCIVTNVKTLSIEEIDAFLNSQNKEESNEDDLFPSIN